MKFLLLSDTHLLNKNPIARLDNAIDICLDKFEFILRYANKHNLIILQSGDLFDSPRSWKLLPRVINLLKKYKDVKILCVYGQHDTYMYSEETKSETNLGILIKSDLATELNNNPVVFHNYIQIYGVSYGFDIPKIQDKKAINILVIHAPISTEGVYYNHEYIKAKIFLRKNKFDLILCGDIHKSFIEKINNRIICNTGPMIRKAATDYNLSFKPHFLVYDTITKEIEKIEIPHKKSIDVLSRDHIENSKETDKMLDDFIQNMESPYVFEGKIHKIQNNNEISINILQNIINFCKLNNIDDDIKTILSETIDDTI